MAYNMLAFHHLILNMELSNLGVHQGERTFSVKKRQRKNKIKYLPL
jgi:hypothetical protein